MANNWTCRCVFGKTFDHRIPIDCRDKEWFLEIEDAYFKLHNDPKALMERYGELLEEQAAHG